MADVNVKVQVNSNLPEVNKDAEKFEKTLNRVASTSARIPKAVAAAQQGVAASNAAKSGQGETKTARSVGAGGGTGSAASDFAAQAQGLGGLVHVYATFAANLFAISAGFNALSKSMDNVNLVKGLDQIGAASGRNLGSLAKQMVAVADGAISLRDAMTSTALASSGGMTNSAILRMTEVAKKASLALGRDLPDSMERLTKGIVKIQPELLDELGIMARVIPAQQNYAREIGKTIGALTDFEKRQAFANAVLAEGEKKFGAIALDANPYSKVLASIQNLMQSGLELVNKVLGPIMSALSASPTGLAIALGGIATMLLKQALPALGMFRENAKRMAEEATVLANKRSKDAKDAALGQVAQARATAEAMADAEIAASDRAIEKLKALRASSTVGKKSRAILEKIPSDVTDADLKHLDAQAARFAKTNIAVADSYREISSSLRLSRDLEIKAGEAVDLHTAALQRKLGLFDIVAQQQRIADKANQEATTRRISSVWAENTQLVGFFKASKQGWADLIKAKKDSVDADGNSIKGITNFQMVTAGVTNTVKSAASGIMTLASSLGNVFMVVGLVTAVLAIMDNVMSTSAKEAKAFEGALDTLTSSFENIDRTLDIINKKELLEFLSVSSIQAKATALDDLGGSLSGVVAKFLKLQQAQSGWDRFFDGFWDMFGKGSADKLALGVSTSVIDAMRLLENGPAKLKAKEAIQAIIGNQPVNFENIKEFNARIKDLDKAQVGDIGRKIEKVLADASREAGNAASALTAFKNSLGEVTKQAATISNSLMPTDDFSKMGIVLNATASSMAIALKDPINGLVALKEIAGDTRALSFLDPKLGLELATAKKQIEEVAQALASAKKEEEDASNKLSMKKGVINTNPAMSIVAINAREAYEIDKKRFTEATKRVALEQKNADEIRTKFADTAQELAKVGYDNLAKGLNKALSEAAITSAKGYLDIIKSAGGDTAVMDAELSKKQISLQIEDIKAKYGNTTALTRLTLATEKATIVSELSLLDAQKARAGGKDSIVSKIDDRVAELTKNLSEVDRALGILGTGSKGIRAASQAAAQKDANPELVSAMSRLTDTVLQSFGMDSALAKLFGEMGDAELKRQAGVFKDQSSRANKALDVSGKGLAVEASDIANMQALQSSYSAALNSRKEMLAIKELELKADKDINTLMAQYDTQALVLMKYKEGTNEYAEASLVTERILNELSSSLADKEEKLAGIRQKSLQDRLIGEESLRRVEANRLNTSFQSYMDIELARIAQKDSELAYLRDIGAIEASTFTLKQGELALDALNIANAKEIAEVNRKYNEDRIAAENALKVIQEANRNRAPDRAFDTTAETAALKEINEEHTKQITKLGIINDTKKDSIKLTAEHKTMQEAHNEAMSKMVSITEGLNTVFGEMGTNLGKIGEAILKMSQDEEVYYKRKIALEAETANARDNAKLNPEAYKAALNAESKLDKKRTSEELGNMISIAGAAKKMFGERTAAAKMFGAVEKALSVLRIASMIQEAVVALSTVGPVVAAEGAKATAGGITAVINAMKSLPPPFSFIAGAAMAAAVASVLGNSSAGSVTPPGGFGSEDRQKSQGTGQSWVDGKLVDNGGGTFGDSEAKSESIKNSLEIIKETSVEGLSFSNKMLDTLISIDRGVNESAKGLYSVGGLRSGSGFGTEEGKSGSKGFLGIGGSTTETSIKDSGILLKGTFLELTQAGKNAISTFENVAVHETSQGFWGLGGSDETTFKTNVGTLEGKVQDQIANIFSHGRDLFMQVGETLQMSVESIDTILGGVNIDEIASLRGLKGADLEKEMSSVIGNILDTAAGSLFKKFEKFREFGEGMTETVIRVVDGSNKLHLAFNSIGLSLKQVTETSSSVTEDMLARVSKAENDIISAREAAGKLSLETRGNYVDTGGSAESGSTGFTEWITELKPNATAIANLSNAEKELADARTAVLDATTTGTTNNYAITEALIKSAGGLSSFLEQTKSFKDNFLTEAEQIKPVQQAVITEMQDITSALGGVADGVITTKDQFKALVLSLDLTTESGRVAYQKLMNVQEAFVGVFDYWDKLAQDFTGNFLTAAEKLGPAQKLLNVEMAKIAETLGLASLASIDTKAEFKNLVLSLDRTTTSGAAAYNSLMQVQGQFLTTIELLNAVATAAQTTALGISASLAQAETSATKIVDGAFDAVKTEISTQRKAAQDAYNIRIKALELEAKNLKDIYDTAVEAQNLIKKNASKVKEFLETELNAEKEKADEEYKVASKALKDQSKAAVKAYETASTSLDSTIEALKLSVDKLRSLDSLLDGAMNFFKSQDKSIESRIAGQDRLNAALIEAQAGNFPTAESLADAIAAVTQPSDQYFSSFVDYQRDLYRTSNTISKLSGLTKAQLSTEEQSLNALIDTKSTIEKNHEEHMKKLDEQIEALDAARDLQQEAFDLRQKAIDDTYSKAVKAADAELERLSDKYKADSSAIEKKKEDAKTDLTDVEAKLDEQLARATEAYNNIKGIKDNTSSIEQLIRELIAKGPAYKDATTAVVQDKLTRGNVVAMDEIEKFKQSIVGLTAAQQEAQIYLFALNHQMTNEQLAGILGVKSADIVAYTESKGLTDLNTAIDTKGAFDTGVVSGGSLLTAANNNAAGEAETAAKALEAKLAEDKIIKEYVGSIIAQVQSGSLSIESGYRQIANRAISLNVTSSRVEEALFGSKNGSIMSAINDINSGLDPSNKIPAFASGGYHEGGMRIVGENGPEIEMTGPSRILNSQQTSEALSEGARISNKEVVAELVKLRKAFELVVVNTNRSTKIADRWDTDGLPAERTAT